MSEKELELTQEAGILSASELRAPLLAPKLRLPQPRSSFILRERLLVQLDASLESKLTLISASAGFGKTTLVSQWIHERRKQTPAQPHLTFPPVAWFALEPSDNDQIRFWRYLLTACQVFQPEIAFTQLLTTQPHPLTYKRLEMVIASFVNELNSLRHDAVLVIEDYHLIQTPAIHEMMTFLIDHLPPTLHLLLISRSNPPLPLARWRARDELLEIHSQDLRFSSEETLVFLQQAFTDKLPPTALQQLEMQSEGWPTGLRLTTLALRGHTTPQGIEHFLRTFRGSQRHILEYILAEVLSMQPEPVQQFLIKTAILSRLTAPLCTVLTDREDSALLLEQLERDNLFLIRLDEEGQWYRYHMLFAEAMQHETRRILGEEHLLALYARASAWYEQHGMLSDAVEAALGARQFARAIELISNVLGPDHFARQQEYYTLRRWFEQIPEEILASFPDFCFLYANMLLFVPERSAPRWGYPFEKPLRAAEQAWQATGNTVKLGTVRALRALLTMMQGQLLQALPLALEALEYLPEQEMFWRGISMGVKGDVEFWTGELNTAQQTLQVAYELNEKITNLHGARANLIKLANTYQGQGKLHQAELTYRRGLLMAEKDPVDRAAAYLGLAQLAYEWNRLEEATAFAEMALTDNKQQEDETLQIFASLLLVHVLCAQKEHAEAQQRLTRFLEELSPHKIPLPYREVLALQARLHLAVGDLAAVQRWQATYVESYDDILPRRQQEQEAAIQARLLIARGAYKQACTLLTPWQTTAAQAGRLYHELEIRILLALALFYDGQPVQAQKLFIEIVNQAYLEGYQRLFLDEGEMLAPLLSALRSTLKDQAIMGYISTLLQLLTSPGTVPATPPPGAAAPQPGDLLEPLSPQEQQVLKLLVAGRSNPEIAAELIVSINTVKAHVKNIYRKLDVHNRIEASDVARNLKLL